MSDGRLDSEWNQVSHVLAMLANTTRDPEAKEDPFQPDDFNPRAKPKPDVVEPKHEVGVLKCFGAGGTLPVMKIKAKKKPVEVTDGNQ